MRMLSSVAVAATLAFGCSTPMERARQLCNEFGDPSPACLERRFDIERKNEAEFQKQFNPSPEKSAPTAPQKSESGYDRMLEQLKEDCLNRGGQMIGQTGCQLR